MILFSIENLSIEEIAAMRQSLNVIDIKGSSAQFIATLQTKLDNEISSAQQILKQEEAKKTNGIKEIENAQPAKKSTRKTKS